MSRLEHYSVESKDNMKLLESGDLGHQELILMLLEDENTLCIFIVMVILYHYYYCHHNF